MEAYLALRGLRTLPLRLAQAQASAQMLAERLAGQSSVQHVRFPDSHRSWSRSGATNNVWLWHLISIDSPDAKTAEAFVDGCSLWVLATSLGGVESTLERRRRWGAELQSVPEGLVRMSVGIEHVEDFRRADLAQALDRV